MSHSLSFDDRKTELEKENLTFSNCINLLTLNGVEKETAYKVKKVAVLEDQLSPVQVIGLAHRKSVDFVIQNSLQSLSEKIKILHQIDQSPDSFYNENFSFFPKNSGRHKIIFDAETPRQTILNLAFHRLQIDIDASRSLNLKAALEELLMNVQIDARNLTETKDNRKAYLILEKNDKMVAVSIIDIYGTLTYGKFLAQIESCLNIGVSSSINHNVKRGAGIGSSIIFGALDSLFLGCIPGKKTRVTAIIPFGLSDRNQEKLQKSVFLI